MFVLLFLSLLATWLDNTSSNTVLQVKHHQDALVLCLHLIKMKQTCLSNTNTAFYHKQLLWCFSKQKKKLKKSGLLLSAARMHTGSLWSPYIYCKIDYNKTDCQQEMQSFDQNNLHLQTLLMNLIYSNIQIINTSVHKSLIKLCLRMDISLLGLFELTNIEKHR